jgi:RND family efflux transporter MFP subunit
MMTPTTNGAMRAQEIPMKNIVTRYASLVTVVALSLVACGGGATEEPPAAADSAAAPPAVQVPVAGLATVDSSRIESGPSFSGTLIAERSAQLRPQVGGTVLAVRVRAGDRVAAGQAIAVIDTLVLADQVRSARLGVTSAELAAQTAERNLARSTELHRAGAIAERDLEGARNQSAQAVAMLEDARARLASAAKQLSNATLRAPFSGTVSEVPVSVGDVVQPGGNPVAVVVDLGSLELEASVPATNLSSLRVGAPVEFTVTAHPGRVFEGRVARVNPAVDATTGQLRLYVRVPNADRTLAAGLFAEGRVATEAERGLSVPTAAIDERAARPAVKRVRGGVVQVVEVTLGLRDELAERVQVLSGVQLGDTVLVGASVSTPAGATVRTTTRDN